MKYVIYVIMCKKSGMENIFSKSFNSLKDKKKRSFELKLF